MRIFCNFWPVIVSSGSNLIALSGLLQNAFISMSCHFVTDKHYFFFNFNTGRRRCNHRLSDNNTVSPWKYINAFNKPCSIHLFMQSFRYINSLQFIYLTRPSYVRFISKIICFEAAIMLDVNYNSIVQLNLAIASKCSFSYWIGIVRNFPFFR